MPEKLRFLLSHCLPATDLTENHSAECRRKVPSATPRGSRNTGVIGRNPRDYFPVALPALLGPAAPTVVESINLLPELNSHVA